MKKTSKTNSRNYLLSIDLSVLNDLGINLYSNIPAVLSEVVANSWDADATEVNIHFDESKKTITITDNGHGMSEGDINDKYLKVGYKRREAGENKTAKYKREVMGRKGIGKLSLFAIADSIQVESIKKENGEIEKNGLTMNGEKIKKFISEGGRDYKPEIIPEASIRITEGTRIVLSDLKKDIIGQEQYLRTRLARRFSIFGKEYKFEVKINGKELSIEDRNFFKKIEYLWTIGPKGKKYKSSSGHSHHTHLEGVVNKSKGYIINGWIGSFPERKSIEDGNNTIAVLARGKLIHEDILKDLDEGGLYTKYLIGEIRADFLDDDDQPDMATTDRQSLKEDDPRFDILKKFIKKQILKRVEQDRAKWKGEDASKKALENKAVKSWFENLGSDHKRHAEKMFATIGSFNIEDEKARKELYKHAILAFEKLALKQTLDELKEVKTEQEFTLLTKLFANIDEIEASEYHSLVKGRLVVLKKFESIVPKSKEKVIQKYIFDHLWLLHPSWERASTNERVEEAVTTEFKIITAKLTADERKGRIDIRYKTAANKHIIVELKKYNVAVNVHDLCKQVSKYRNALEKCLKEKFGETNPNIEAICILGSPPTPIENDQQNQESLKVEKARYITYDTLIKESIDSYRDYLDKHRKIDAIQKLVDTI